MYAKLKSFTGMIAIIISMIVLAFVVWFATSMVAAMSVVKIF
ncbi:MAG: hypothetical protein WBZ29_13310 [Methanocella sp.]